MTKSDDFGFEVLENAFLLKYGHPNVYYIQNFLFILGILGIILWPLFSGRFLSVPPDFFVMALNYLIIFTLISRFSTLGAKKFILVTNYAIGFMTILEWLKIGIISVQSFIIFISYLMASLWVFALAQTLRDDSASYCRALMMVLPISAFGASLMFLNASILWVNFLFLYIFFVWILKLLSFKFLVKFTCLFPEFPFLLPIRRKRKFFDILSIENYNFGSVHNKNKSKILLIVEHILWFLCSPVILLPLVTLLDFNEAQEEKIKRSIIQYIRESPTKGMVTPKDVGNLFKKSASMVSRHLNTLVREQGLKKYYDNFIVFVDPGYVNEEDFWVLRFFGKLSVIDPDAIPSDFREVLYIVSFCDVDSIRNLIQVTGLKRESLERIISQFEKIGLIKLVSEKVEYQESPSLEEILKTMKQRYDSLYGTVSERVMKNLQKKPCASELSENIRTALGVMITRTLLATYIFEREFSNVAKKADDLFLRATSLKRTFTSYKIPIEKQRKVIESVLSYVQNDIKTRFEEPFGEKVRWPWDTMDEGGDCDCKSVLLASMLAHLGFIVKIRIIPPNLTLGHAFITVLLKPEDELEVLLDLDPSDYRCHVGEISQDYRPYREKACSIDLERIAKEIELTRI